jgi:hypothetical protein
MSWNDSALINWGRHWIVVLRPQVVLGIYAALLILYITVLHPWLMYLSTANHIFDPR